MSECNRFVPKLCNDRYVDELPRSQPRAEKIQLKRTIGTGLHVRPAAAWRMRVVHSRMKDGHSLPSDWQASRTHRVCPELRVKLGPPQIRILLGFRLPVQVLLGIRV